MTVPMPSRILTVAALTLMPAALGIVAGETMVAPALAGGVAVLAGIGVIRLARGRWMTAPHLMLTLCFAGMVIGLLADRQVVLPATLLSLCVASPSLVESILDHFAILPAMSFGMIFGGFATILVVELRAAARPAIACRRAICARAGFNLACNATMFAGMLGGAWAAPHLAAAAGLPPSVAVMMAAMGAGMVWGMAATMTLYRSALALAARRGHPGRRITVRRLMAQ
jgi:hypothetical protein